MTDYKCFIHSRFGIKKHPSCINKPLKPAYPLVSKKDNLVIYKLIVMRIMVMTIKVKSPSSSALWKCNPNYKRRT